MTAPDLIEKQNAEQFIEDLMTLASDDARLINGMMMLFELFARQRNLVDSRDMAEDLQRAIYRGTLAHEKAYFMFKNGVIRRANWDSVLGEEV